MSITCEKATQLMILSLDGATNLADQLNLDTHVAGCTACKHELVQMQQMHGQLASLPVPEPDMQLMRTHFDQMLNEYKQATGHSRQGWYMGLKEYLQAHWQPSYTLQLAMGLLLLIIGWGGGYLFHTRTSGDSQQISQLASEVQQMREAMLLTMLQQPAATDRLKAVTYTNELDQVDDKVINALLQTLNNDPNVNVRLVTVEALHKLANHPEVREGLIQSITQQDSPLVQIALADVMVALQEKNSVNAFKELLKKKDIDVAVKAKIENSVNVLM
ncbi:HEAT repeat domain-containing protein [Rhodocytophaga aerolata]|uniref:HEAT repeat domain-containing protein n=1 Tax=Rhodocytophaga aerolata TaxID=455078 RepID=A0ABT8R651_9BACT|nr:HEAT repeat domain-containing protein [Rhodocytophaga aerolata]MDO1447131.1 HEAT repeat domain-containing protein [Rhodocytophaga aerolata]